MEGEGGGERPPRPNDRLKNSPTSRTEREIENTFADQSFLCRRSGWIIFRRFGADDLRVIETTVYKVTLPVSSVKNQAFLYNTLPSFDLNETKSTPSTDGSSLVALLRGFKRV